MKNYFLNFLLFSIIHCVEVFFLYGQINKIGNIILNVSNLFVLKYNTKTFFIHDFLKLFIRLVIWYSVDLFMWNDKEYWQFGIEFQLYIFSFLSKLKTVNWHFFFKLCIHPLRNQSFFQKLLNIVCKDSHWHSYWNPNRLTIPSYIINYVCRIKLPSAATARRNTNPYLTVVIHPIPSFSFAISQSLLSLSNDQL